MFRRPNSKRSPRTIHRTSSRSLLCWALVIGTLIHSAIAQADAPSAPNINFVDAAPLTLSPDADGQFSFKAALKNTGTAAGTPSFALQAGDDTCKGSISATPDNSMNAGAITIAELQIKLDALPATCYVDIKTLGTNQAIVGQSLKQVKLTQQYATPCVLLALVGCFGLALITVLASGARAQRQMPNQSLAKMELGSPSWDFATSWFSTVTVASGVISAALSLSALPELTRYASKSGYALLVLLFSLLVILAPFIFMLFRRGAIEVSHSAATDTTPPKNTVTYRGSARAFFATCLITLFAGLSQFLVFFLLLAEVFHGYPTWVFIAGAAVLIVLAVAICWYAFRSMLLTIELELPHRADSTSRTMRDIFMGNDAVNIIKEKPARSAPANWPLL